MSSGELPTQFEGDERSDTTSEDILQLVSGRQLLGIVRTLHVDLLEGIL